MTKKTVLFVAAALILPLGAAAAQEAAAPAEAAQPAEAAPAADAAPQGEPGPVVAAEQADFAVGATVRDPNGGLVGKLETVSAEGAVVGTGKSRVLLPFASFAKNNHGLLISLTQAQLDAQVAASAGGSAAAE